MNTSVQKLENTRVKLTITLSAEEVDSAISAAYARTASKVRIAGFRAGKAPRQLIDTHVGREQVLADALEALVEDSYPRALDDEKLRPIERPDTGTLDGLAPGEEYTFSAEFDCRPELLLSSTKDLKVVAPPASTSDREIDAQIGHLRDRFASLEPVEDRVVQAGDFTMISFVGTVDGEPYEGNEVDKYLYELGSGQMPAEFDAAMIGANLGETVTASFAIPDTSATPEFVGKTAGFEITVHEIKAKLLPEVNDEFAANAGGFESLDQMRDDIRAKLDENKAAGRVRQLERDARQALMDRLEGDVPQTMVDSKANQMFEEFFEGLAERGVTMEKYVEATGVDPSQVQADIALEAGSRVRDALALEALFRVEGLEITDAEIADELASLAADEKTDVATLAARLAAGGLMPLVRETMMHRKAVRWLMDNVEFIDEEVAEATAAPKKAAAKPRAAKSEKPAKAAAKEPPAAKTASGKKAKPSPSTEE